MSTISAPSYAKELITKQYQITNNSVDLNKNGKIEANERVIDINNNGVIGDNADFINFLDRNSLQIRKDISFIDYGKGLNSSNIIHDLLNIEAEMVKPEETKLAYEKLTKLINTIKKELSLEKNKGLSLEDKIKLAYKVILQSGFKVFDYTNTHLVTLDLVRGILDYDSLCSIAITLGDEMGWNVELAIYKEHTLIKAEDAYVDVKVHETAPPKKNLEGSKFNTLTRAQAKSLWLVNRAMLKSGEMNFQGALNDYNKAIELFPKSSLYLLNRGIVKINLNDYKGALEDFNKSIEIKPYALTYKHRSVVKTMLGDDTGATEDLYESIGNGNNFIELYCVSLVKLLHCCKIIK